METITGYNIVFPQLVASNINIYYIWPRPYAEFALFVTPALALGLGPSCRLIKTRVYYRMSNFKYGASCTDVMYTKLEHPTNNLKDTRLFAGKLKIGKLKIFINVKNNFIVCLAWLLVSWPTLIHLQVLLSPVPSVLGRLCGAWHPVISPEF
jgi:hypothetical protein